MWGDDAVTALAARFLGSRRATRLPVPMFTHGLGWVLGGRVLMLTHRGRHSGRPRHVCLEVVDRPDRDRVAVVSGFGTAAQWYRNLQADPACRVSIGRRRDVPARARLLDPAEGAQVIGRYRAAHPRTWRMLQQTMARLTGEAMTDPPVVELVLEPLTRRP